MEMTIAASLIASFVDYAAMHGVDRSTMLSAGSLSETDLRDPDARVSADSYGTIIETAIKLTGDTGLPMRHAADQRLEHLSIVGLIVATSRTLSETIQQLNRYVRLIADIPLPEKDHRFKLVQTRDETWLVDTLPVSLAGPAAIEAAFASFISSSRNTEPSIPFVIEATVTFDPPPHADLYQEIFQAPTRFGAKRNALRVHPHWVTFQKVDAPQYALSLFVDHAAALLASLKNTETLRARVEEQILRDLHQGPVARDHVARELGVSERTLHRRRKDEGMTYAEVYDGVRDRMAREYLKTDRVTVSEIAFLLGFSESSAFVRAFRRWPGFSPSDFRQSLV